MNLGTGRWAGILAVLTSNLFSLMSCHPFFRCQVLNVVRNPKDAMVSYFFHHKLFKFMHFAAHLDTFAEYYMKDLHKN